MAQRHEDAPRAEQHGQTQVAGSGPVAHDEESHQGDQDHRGPLRPAEDARRVAVDQGEHDGAAHGNRDEDDDEPGDRVAELALRGAGAHHRFTPGTNDVCVPIRKISAMRTQLATRSPNASRSRPGRRHTSQAIQRIMRKLRNSIASTPVGRNRLRTKYIAG